MTSMLAALALSLLSICGSNVGAAVVAPESGVRASVRSSPLSVPSFVAAPILSETPTLTSAPDLAVVPTLAETSERDAAAPALEAAAALQASPDAPSPGARLILDQAASPEPEMSAAFDGRDLSPVPEAAAAQRRPTRFRLHSAEELEAASAASKALPPQEKSSLFLYRHERFVRPAVIALVRLFYDVRIEGVEHLPSGAVLIVPNHVSWLDALLITYVAGRPVRFLMYRPYYETFGMKWLFRSFGMIPIAPKEPKELVERALNQARSGLSTGDAVGAFPEGQMTRDGDLGIFRGGFGRVADGLDVPVVPAHIDGMWGSALSRYPVKYGRLNLLARLFGRLFGRLLGLRSRRVVTVRFGPKLKRIEPAFARDAVSRLAPR